MEVLLLIYYWLIIIMLMYFLYRERITPVTIFIAAQAMFFTGYIKYFQFSNIEDMKIAGIYTVGILFFGWGAGLGGCIHPVNRNVVFCEQPLSKRQRQIVTIIVVISVLLFVYFCYQTQLSTVRTMIGNLLLNQSADITDLRLASYSVSGTAYIYLFRITLLPTVVVAMLRKENKYSKVTKTFLLIFMISFTLITGQRGGFVMVMFMWILSYMMPILYQNKNLLTKKNRRNVVILFCILLAAFYFLSSINGRISDNFINAVLQRFLNDNQNTGYYAFKYIFYNGTCWGQNYYEEIVNLIVPGDEYLPLSKVIFGIMYGTTRGTAPACLWGSVYYNFSWIGVIIFGFVYGLLAQYIGWRFFRREINSIRCVIYSYMFIDIGMLMAGGPLQLFNNGFVFLVILAYILHVDRSAKLVMNRSYKYNT